MVKTAKGYELIDAKEALEDLETLKEKVIYNDTFLKLTKEEQGKIYMYCLTHCTFDVVKDNLSQIRYAITRQYFGI